MAGASGSLEKLAIKLEREDGENFLLCTAFSDAMEGILYARIITLLQTQIYGCLYCIIQNILMKVSSWAPLYEAVYSVVGI